MIHPHHRSITIPQFISLSIIQPRPGTQVGPRRQFAHLLGWRSGGIALLLRGHFRRRVLLLRLRARLRMMEGQQSCWTLRGRLRQLPALQGSDLGPQSGVLGLERGELVDGLRRIFTY